MGEYENAREYHEESLAIFRDIGNRKGEAQSLSNLGPVAQAVGEYENAREYHEESLAIFRDIGDRQGEANSLVDLGYLSQFGIVAQYDEEELELLLEGLEIARDIGHRPLIAKSLVSVGVVRAQQSQSQNIAEQNLERALEISKDIHNRKLIATSLAGLGSLHHEKDQLDDACEHLRAAHEISDEIDHHTLRMHCAMQLGSCTMDMGDVNAARDWYEAAIEAATTAGNIRIALIVSSYAIELSAEIGDRPRAIEHCRQSLELLEKNDNPLSHIKAMDESWFQSTLEQLRKSGFLSDPNEDSEERSEVRRLYNRVME